MIAALAINQMGIVRGGVTGVPNLHLSRDIPEGVSLCLETGPYIFFKKMLITRHISILVEKMMAKLHLSRKPEVSSQLSLLAVLVSD